MTLPLREEEEVESEELVEDTLPRGCSGSAVGRCAAAVCSWSRREASAGDDIDAEGVDGLGRKARRGLWGSANVCGEYSETGVV